MKRLLALLALGLAGFTSALAAPPTVTLRTVVAGGLASPVEIAHAGDGSMRLFIAEQDGLIRIVNKNGTLLAAPFLNITDRTNMSGERGLLGLAFHPQYAANRKFYVFYTRTVNPVGALQISEFLASAANPDLANAGSERPIITIAHSAFDNHNGGRIAFGPDGYLYIATGDGGGGDDPGNNAENLNSLLGKLLRLDVNGDDFPGDATRNYAIPPSNPFVGVAGADEIWAYGLRNPWRFSFDRRTGDLFIADVGQDRREEVNFEPAGSAGGRNYGWDIMEGSLCNEEPPSCDPLGEKVLPILEHARGDGWRSVIGGYVYRGRKSASLRGFYIYGDFFVPTLRAASPNGDGSWSTFELVQGPVNPNYTAFGEDEAGEIYVVRHGGSLHAIDGPNDPVPPRGDLNGNGRADVLWRNIASGVNYAYLMNGTAIQDEGYLSTVADLAWKIVVTGDFDGNGKADVFWRNTSTGANYIYLMDGKTIVGEGYISTVTDQNWTVAGAGDFDGDGRDDVLWRNTSTGENYLYPMNGLTILASEGYLRTVADLNWKIAGIGDLDGDGRADIVWRNSATGQNYLHPMLGLAIKPTEGHLPTVADLDWEIVGVGDFNGDGKDDILWRNAVSGENYLYPMAGTTVLASEGHLQSVRDVAWRIVQVGDFNADGRSDILWRRASSGENYVYLMSGSTIVGESYLHTVADQNWRVVPARTAELLQP